MQSSLSIALILSSLCASVTAGTAAKVNVCVKYDKLPAGPGPVTVDLKRAATNCMNQIGDADKQLIVRDTSPTCVSMGTVEPSWKFFSDCFMRDSNYNLDVAFNWEDDQGRYLRMRDTVKTDWNKDALKWGNSTVKVNVCKGSSFCPETIPMQKASYDEGDDVHIDIYPNRNRWWIPCDPALCSRQWGAFFCMQQQPGIGGSEEGGVWAWEMMKCWQETGAPK